MSVIGDDAAVGGAENSKLGAQQIHVVHSKLLWGW